MRGEVQLKVQGYQRSGRKGAGTEEEEKEEEKEERKKNGSFCALGGSVSEQIKDVSLTL